MGEYYKTDVLDTKMKLMNKYHYYKDLEIYEEKLEKDREKTDY